MVQIELDIGGTIFKVRRIGDFAARPHALWDEIQEHQISRSQLMFRNLGKGGTYRGVTWEPFADSYTRRPSGNPRDESSALLQDTGRLATAVATVRQVIGDTILLSTPVEYAGYHQSTPIGSDQRQVVPERPFSFFTDDDLDYYARFALERMTAAFRRRTARG